MRTTLRAELSRRIAHPALVRLLVGGAHLEVARARLLPSDDLRHADGEAVLAVFERLLNEDRRAGDLDAARRRHLLARLLAAEVFGRVLLRLIVIQRRSAQNKVPLLPPPVAVAEDPVLARLRSRQLLEHALHLAERLLATDIRRLLADLGPVLEQLVDFLELLVRVPLVGEQVVDGVQVHGFCGLGTTSFLV